MLLFLFWSLLFCSIFSYFLYPVLLLIFRRVGSPPITTTPSSPPPSVSLIITAHNEQARLRNKLENSLKIDYPSEKLEIIVASDGSTDQTDSISEEYSDKGVKLVRPEERLGKENAQKTAITHASGDIVVFSDVATEIPHNALTLMTQYFSDETIGAVSSEDRFISSDGSVAGEGAYVKYEMWLRQQESELAGLVGLSGSFFAARKEICNEWDIHAPSDFNTALNCTKNGYRAVSAPDVLGFYPDLKDPSKEYSRKIRTVIRGMTALARHPEVLNPFKYKLFAFQVFSHKIMRWLEPWFLIGLLGTTIALAPSHGFFSLCLIAQLAFYGVATIAHYKQSTTKLSPVKIIYFFVQVNLALLDASLKFLTGTRMTTWKPSAR
ncbi:MAG: glycosyltransferase family 2 protein [Cellvibrionaceae bacterium]